MRYPGEGSDSGDRNRAFISTAANATLQVPACAGIAGKMRSRLKVRWGWLFFYGRRTSKNYQPLFTDILDAEIFDHTFEIVFVAWISDDTGGAILRAMYKRIPSPPSSPPVVMWQRACPRFPVQTRACGFGRSGSIDGKARPQRHRKSKAFRCETPIQLASALGNQKRLRLRAIGHRVPQPAWLQPASAPDISRSVTILGRHFLSLRSLLCARRGNA